MCRRHGAKRLLRDTKRGATFCAGACATQRGAARHGCAARESGSSPRAKGLRTRVVFSAAATAQGMCPGGGRRRCFFAARWALGSCFCLSAASVGGCRRFASAAPVLRAFPAVLAVGPPACPPPPGGWSVAPLVLFAWAPLRPCRRPARRGPALSPGPPRPSFLLFFFLCLGLPACLLGSVVWLGPGPRLGPWPAFPSVLACLPWPVAFACALARGPLPPPSVGRCPSSVCLSVRPFLRPGRVLGPCRLAALPRPPVPSWACGPLRDQVARIWCSLHLGLGDPSVLASECPVVCA